MSVRTFYDAEIAISDYIVCMVQLYAVVAKLGEVCFKWFVLLWSASTDLAKNVLSADIGSGGVFDDAPYFRGTGKSDY